MSGKLPPLLQYFFPRHFGLIFPTAIFKLWTFPLKKIEKKCLFARIYHATMTEYDLSVQRAPTQGFAFGQVLMDWPLANAYTFSLPAKRLLYCHWQCKAVMAFLQAAYIVPNAVVRLSLSLDVHVINDEIMTALEGSFKMCFMYIW